MKLRGFVDRLLLEHSIMLSRKLLINTEQLKSGLLRLQLKVSFASEYKEYLASFGAIMADGIELSRIA